MDEVKATGSEGAVRGASGQAVPGREPRGTAGTSDRVDVPPVPPPQLVPTSYNLQLTVNVNHRQIRR
jgi:hypothetical protein